MSWRLLLQASPWRRPFSPVDTGLRLLKIQCRIFAGDWLIQLHTMYVELSPLQGVHCKNEGMDWEITRSCKFPHVRWPWWSWRHWAPKLWRILSASLRDLHAWKWSPHPTGSNFLAPCRNSGFSSSRQRPSVILAFPLPAEGIHCVMPESVVMPDRAASPQDTPSPVLFVSRPNTTSRPSRVVKVRFKVRPIKKSKRSWVF